MPPAPHPANEAERLDALRSYAILDTDREDGFDILAGLAARLMGCPIALVSLVDAQRQWCKARHGWDASETPRELAFCSHAVLDPCHPLVVADATLDMRFADNALVTGRAGVRFYAGMPLVDPAGYALGTLCVIDRVPRTIAPQALDTLAGLAQAVMATLELRRALSQARAMALASAARFARVIENSPDALLLAGPDGRIELASGPAERMFGYERAELRGRALELLIPERFRRRHVDLRRQFQGEMRSRMMNGRGDPLGLRKDGTELPLEIWLTPIDLNGRAMVLAVLIEITARRVAEQETERRYRELERSNADLDEFAYTASHDLKAPVRAIAHLAQWIGEDIGATASAETLDNLRLLRGRATRLQVLLDELLAYARVGRVGSPVEDVDIGEVVREVADLLAPPPGFVVACEAEMPVLRTHRTPLRAVLQNLIGNALKHHDRAAGRVTVAMRMTGGVAEFHVSDDGPGIAPRFHGRIFVMFQTLASRDTVESSGIGLAIVKKLVLRHGGEIRVESGPPARGTTFIFTWREAGA